MTSRKTRVTLQTAPLRTKRLILTPKRATLPAPNLPKKARKRNSTRRIRSQLSTNPSPRAPKHPKGKKQEEPKAEEVYLANQNPKILVRNHHHLHHPHPNPYPPPEPRLLLLLLRLLLLSSNNNHHYQHHLNPQEAEASDRTRKPLARPSQARKKKSKETRRTDARVRPQTPHDGKG